MQPFRPKSSSSNSYTLPHLLLPIVFVHFSFSLHGPVSPGLTSHSSTSHSGQQPKEAGMTFSINISGSFSKKASQLRKRVMPVGPPKRSISSELNLLEMDSRIQLGVVKAAPKHFF